MGERAKNSFFARRLPPQQRRREIRFQHDARHAIQNQKRRRAIIALPHDDFALTELEDARVVAEDFAERRSLGKLRRIHSAERRGGEQAFDIGVRHVRVKRGVPALRTFKNCRGGGHF